MAVEQQKSRVPYKQHDPKWGRSAWPLYFAALVILLLNLQMAGAVLVAQFWSSTDGVITDSKVETPSSRSRIIVRYKFEVAGSLYESDRVYPEFVGLFRVNDLRLRLFKDQKVKVYYNPRNPNNSAIDRSFPGFHLWIFFYIFAFVVFLEERDGWFSRTTDKIV